MKQLTLKEAVECSPSHNEDEIFPDVFTDDCGLDQPSPDGYKTVKEWKTVRKVVLDIETWRGISIGAVHYYGKLEIDGVQSVDENGHSLWSSKFHKGLINSRYYLELKRKVTQKEIDTNPDKWRWYDEGDLTNCFNTTKELKEYAKEIFRLRFSGSNWKLYYKTSSYGNLKPL